MVQRTDSTLLERRVQLAKEVLNETMVELIATYEQFPHDGTCPECGIQRWVYYQGAGIMITDGLFMNNHDVAEKYGAPDADDYLPELDCAESYPYMVEATPRWLKCVRGTCNTKYQFPAWLEIA